MLQHLKPTDEEIEKLALAETDQQQQLSFAPVRYGFFGNGILLVLAGGLGLMHALLSMILRSVLRPFRHGSK